MPKVLEPLEHDQERYMPGENFTGPKEVVAHLQDIGVLESPKAKAKAKAEAEGEGDEE